MSRATQIINLLYGSKLLGSFELVRGCTPRYRPVLCGFPQAKVSNDMLEAFEEQKARRTLKLSRKTEHLMSLTRISCTAMKQSIM